MCCNFVFYPQMLLYALKTSFYTLKLEYFSYKLSLRNNSYFKDAENM